MRFSPTEVKDEDGSTLGWVIPRGRGRSGEWNFEALVYVDRETVKKTFSLFHSAKNFIETGKTI
jgi:hypothetical protein